MRWCKGVLATLHVYPVTHETGGDALIVSQVILHVEVKDDRVQVQEAQGAVLESQGAQGPKGEGMVPAQQEGAAASHGPGPHGGLNGFQRLGQRKGQGGDVATIQPSVGGGGSKNWTALAKPLGHGMGTETHGGRAQGPGPQPGAGPVDDAGIAGCAEHHASGGAGIHAKRKPEEGCQARAKALHEGISGHPGSGARGRF